MKKFLIGLLVGLTVVPTLGFAASTIDAKLVNRLKGAILLQTESHGEAWYLNPKDGKRYYMKDGATAYEMMRKFGAGISNSDLNKIPVGTLPLMNTQQNTVQPSQGTAQAPSESGELITNVLGQDIILSPTTLRFLSSTESSTITGVLGTKQASGGAKFISVNLNVLNTSLSQVTFPFSGFQLVDNQSRKFEVYSDCLMYRSDCILGEHLSPSISKNGSLIFEVPMDATSYGIYIGGSSTKNYWVPLK